MVILYIMSINQIYHQSQMQFLILINESNLIYQL
jgi:hypothetical protein